MAQLWIMGVPPGAAKPAVKTCNMGKLPENEGQKQQYPGVSTKFLPHEADIIYGERLRNEIRTRDPPSTRKWFREHRKKKQEEERVSEIYRKFREMSRSKSEALLAAGSASLVDCCKLGGQLYATRGGLTRFVAALLAIREIRALLRPDRSEASHRWLVSPRAFMISTLECIPPASCPWCNGANMRSRRKHV
eukprot:CAMPEP_0183507264 /NCGR_PEP_ID=MMETSP0371-20130417/8093_1 /TAXON_ID=268820 /ORGANISM="Peridinium aciculiferum, Strain PAER-2" /LENGTH=191 /DNA_ID=CAMNT_0025703439 /DNA_START=71 /DNA_END=647 /DNA_ORIENTATION=+